MLRKNLLFLIPMFFVLGVLYALISYNLQTNKLKWAIDQETHALGHTIQTFAKYNPDRYFVFQSDSVGNITPEFELILSRILTQDRMVRIDVIIPENRTILTLSSSTYNFNVPDSSESQVLYQSDFEGTDYSLIRYKDHSILNVNTQIETEYGNVILQMVRDAHPYGSKIQELRIWIGIEILIALVLGTLLSILLTFIIKRRIDMLTEEAGYFLKGDKQAKLDQGTITEFNDLGSTLNILVNVFNKNMDWYRKSIQQKEQERSSIQLSQFVKDSNSTPIEVSESGLSIIAALTGNKKQHLFLARSKQHSIPLVWGSVTETDPVEASLISEAITDFIARCSDSDLTLTQTLIETFGPQLLELNFLMIDENSDIYIQRSVPKNQQKVLVEVKNASCKWLHTLDESINEKIEMYTQHSPTLSHQKLFQDIMTLVNDIGSTVLIGVKRDQ